MQKEVQKTSFRTKNCYNYNVGDETNCTWNLIVLKLDRPVGPVQLSIGRHSGPVRTFKPLRSGGS